MYQILSPLPGTFYRKPSPDEPEYKSAGDAVNKGDVVGLIEVMKTFIPVNADADGVFAGYAAEDGSPVTAGAPIAELED